MHYSSLIDVAKQIEAMEVSPVDLTKMTLDRIASLDPHLRSYATVMTQQALAAARTAEQEIRSGTYRGPLHGIPIAVKDLCYTRGIRTMGGLGVLADFVPDHDATVIAKLAEAGAIILGKLNLTEGAMAGYHPDFELPINPWGAQLWAGASSSGSGVATAAGLCFASLGSDTGGSIRFPAMANGVVGLKPTYGRVSRYGVLPLAESLDHVGPLARRVADAAVVFEAIAGFDPNDLTSLADPVPNMLKELDRGLKGAQIGFDRDYATKGVDPGLVASIGIALGVLEELGAEIVDVNIPEFGETHVNSWFEICAYEACRAHAANYPARADDYGPYFRDFLGFGSEVSDEAYSQASQLRAEFNAQFIAVLSAVDAVACPGGGVPFPVSAEIQYGDMANFDPTMQNIQMQHTVPADFAGTPTISLPCGTNEDGIPYTFQFLGAHLTESRLCQIAHAYEEATEWHARCPPV
jgi:amidase